MYVLNINVSKYRICTMVRPLFHVSISGSWSVLGRFLCWQLIPRFNIRIMIRMGKIIMLTLNSMFQCFNIRIMIRIRKIFMLTLNSKFQYPDPDPYQEIFMRTLNSTFQYPSNVSDYVYFSLNCAHIIVFSFTGKCNTFYPICGDK